MNAIVNETIEDMIEHIKLCVFFFLQEIKNNETKETDW